ncbi:hypothetical protein A6A06_01125 [Streptomyces sp. CB02923]|uniref:DUF6415 family natural product biosynthesis protein n=1 Tax=Streptomyces sp. CB02923 TaxID=1718985 RepID=UPI00093C05D6|nr:DUF6415 family natural product biosynthesis protein [Streptomyces sp. CB02923]OKI09347.1 hypothetical protein A6A06_01125 [Streptomyces sp. CB02923]
MAPPSSALAPVSPLPFAPEQQGRYFLGAGNPARLAPDHPADMVLGTSHLVDTVLSEQNPLPEGEQVTYLTARLHEYLPHLAQVLADAPTPGAGPATHQRLRAIDRARAQAGAEIVADPLGVRIQLVRLAQVGQEVLSLLLGDGDVDGAPAGFSSRLVHESVKVTREWRIPGTYPHPESLVMVTAALTDSIRGMCSCITGLLSHPERDGAAHTGVRGAAVAAIEATRADPGCGLVSATAHAVCLASCAQPLLEYIERTHQDSR